MIEDVFTCTVAANHSEVIDRLNTGANACDQTGCPGRSLCEQYSIACPVLANLILNMLGETLNEFPLHILLTIEVRECSFLNRDREKYMQGKFIQRLPQHIQDKIRKHGTRNAV